MSRYALHDPVAWGDGEGHGRLRRVSERGGGGLGGWDETGHCTGIAVPEQGAVIAAPSLPLVYGRLYLPTTAEVETCFLLCFGQMLYRRAPQSHCACDRGYSVVDSLRLMMQ